MPTVAIAAEFLDAFADLPKAQQKKVREFTEKFKANPKSASINYEKIRDMRDPKVRTVRIGLDYRAIILHPDHGDVFVLMWVDHHDEAMTWAKNRIFEVNPQTGSLQVISTDAATAVPVKAKRTGPLADHDDDLLLSFGVPALLLPAVRAVERPEDLSLLGKHLPDEATEALIWLAEGLPPEEVREAVASREPTGEVDTSDLEAALQHPDSKRRFVTLHTDGDLTAMLDAPLAKWRVFLHPSQEKLVTRLFNGPVRVTGGAGTGKTVVAMHRARHLARQAKDGQKVLFTTYTANLAQDVQHNLAGLCGEEKTRIEVVHLHAWAARFLRDQGIEVQVADQDDLDRCWEDAFLTAEATSFDLGFLRQEWELVVQANDITSEAAYLRVSRAGRGTTLNRSQRALVWKVFELFQTGLRNLGKTQWHSVIREARKVLDEKKPSLQYRAVVVDEAQDFHPEEWRLIRALIPAGADDLFIVGDAHQRIYGQKVALRSCGINIQGRSSKLRINYRTTEQIRAWATALLSGVEIDDLDGERDTGKGYRSLLDGPAPEIRRFAKRSEEKTFLAKRIKELIGKIVPESICLVARTNKMLREDYEPILKDAGIAHTILDKHRDGPGVRLATMHRVKGLEFPVMILAGMNSGVMPLHVKAAETDAVSKADHEARERSLLFVAATRARDLVIVTAYGTPSPFLPATGDKK